MGYAAIAIMSAHAKGTKKVLPTIITNTIKEAIMMRAVILKRLLFVSMMGKFLKLNSQKQLRK
jgi:hypothetical protein